MTEKRREEEERGITMASSSAVSAPLRREVLSVYRLVLRAANKAFQGDQIAINEAHKQIRMHFEVSDSSDLNYCKENRSNRFPLMGNSSDEDTIFVSVLV